MTAEAREERRGGEPAAAGRGGSPARRAALAILERCRTRKDFAGEALDQELQTAALSDQDRRLATQLVYGVLRRRGSLDALVRPFLQRPPHLVEPALWDVLRLGAYQLAFLTQVPAHA